MSDQRFYEFVAEELQRRSLRPGLWARAVAETGGEGETARALYIRLRVAELLQIEQAERARAATEMERRVAEAARMKTQQRDAELRAREEREHRQAQEFEVERSRMDAERAASPYVGWIFLAAIILLLALTFVLGHILSR